MLRKEHALFEYRKGSIFPDRLWKGKHAHYLPLTAKMLDLYKNGEGQTRRDLHCAVEGLFLEVNDCPIKRIRAFCKLLDDASEYDHDQAGRSPLLRHILFESAAPYQPLVKTPTRFFEFQEDAIKEKITQKLLEQGVFKKDSTSSPEKDWRILWKEIEGCLFNDVPEFHRLKHFQDFPCAEAFLAHYNVAQIQAALYHAVDLVVRVSRDFKNILKYAKLAGLMHTIRKTGSAAYEIRLDGPASMMRDTRRYGVAFARFLPALIASQGWKMHARIQISSGKWFASLDLSDQDGLHSHLPPQEEFDSKVEEKFFSKWGASPREGWSLHRETEILSTHQKVFFPDFVFRHEDGRRVYLEIIGFWTPEYLEAKIRTLSQFEKHPIILAVQESLREKIPALPFPVIPYKTALKPSAVLETLQKPPNAS